MGKHGENPAAPKGTTNPKQCEIHSFLESHYSKRTPSSMSAFPNKIASSGKSSLHSCPRRNDFQALASRFPIWGSFFVQSQLQRSFWVCDAWFFFSICSCPLPVKAKTPSSDVPQEVTAHSSQEQARPFKSPPAPISGSLQTRAPTSLISYR